MTQPWKVDLDLGAVATGAAQGARLGLTAGTEHLLAASRRRVPIEEGTLERSGVASVDGAGTRGAVSYDTPYAVVQHEDMSLQHDAGRSAKYLEQAFNSENQVVAELVQAALRRALGT